MYLANRLSCSFGLRLQTMVDRFLEGQTITHSVVVNSRTSKAVFALMVRLSVRFRFWLRKRFVFLFRYRQDSCSVSVYMQLSLVVERYLLRYAAPRTLALRPCRICTLGGRVTTRTPLERLTSNHIAAMRLLLDLLARIRPTHVRRLRDFLL